MKTITMRGTKGRTFDVPGEPTAVIDLYLAPDVDFDGPTLSAEGPGADSGGGRAEE